MSCALGYAAEGTFMVPAILREGLNIAKATRRVDGCLTLRCTVPRHLRCRRNLRGGWHGSRGERPCFACRKERGEKFPRLFLTENRAYRRVFPVRDNVPQLFLLVSLVRAKAASPAAFSRVKGKQSGVTSAFPSVRRRSGVSAGKGRGRASRISAGPLFLVGLPGSVLRTAGYLPCKD